MQLEIVVPQWVKDKPENLLSFLCHYGGLHHNPGSGIGGWADAAGVTRKTVYNSIARGRFTAKSAHSLSNCLPAGVLPAYWLMDPKSVKITDRGTIVYGH